MDHTPWEHGLPLPSWLYGRCLEHPSLLAAVSAVRCHHPGCWPSAVKGVSWCSRNGRIVTLQSWKEAQKVTWSFPASVQDSVTKPCSKGVSVFLKNFQCCRVCVILGYEALVPHHQQLLFFTSRPIFQSTGRKSPGTILPINRSQQPG